MDMEQERRADEMAKEDKEDKPKQLDFAQARTTGVDPGEAAAGEHRVGPRFEQLREIMARLRSDTGCPWDREQTHESLRRYVLEEAYEVAEAIDQVHSEPGKLQEELGDLLLQVLFHAQLAQEEGLFDLADVADTLRRKLIRRHPHVFGPHAGGVKDAEAVARQWDKIKRQERSSAETAQGKVASQAEFADLSAQLPALVRATQVMRRAAEYGFTWRNVEEGLAKVREEVAELEEVICKQAGGVTAESGAEKDDRDLVDRDRNNSDGNTSSRGVVSGGDRDWKSSSTVDSSERFADELGDLLIAVANLARLGGVDPEWALHRAVDKFIRRFVGMEKLAASQGQQLDTANLPQQLRWWQEAKQRLS